MIPDIAFMIVAYGSARLLIAALEPHRRGTGQGAQVATGISWALVIFTIAALAVLGIDVLAASGTPNNLTTR